MNAAIDFLSAHPVLFTVLTVVLIVGGLLWACTPSKPKDEQSAAPMPKQSWEKDRE